MKKLSIDINDYEYLLFGWYDDSTLYDTLEKHSEEIIKWISEKDFTSIRDFLYNECDIYDHSSYYIDFDLENDVDLTISYTHYYEDWINDEDHEDGGYDTEVYETSYIHLNIVEN